MKKEFTNHLAGEKSPYLLQHVHNPVDWYPWCEEAFERAREEEKPIFLSIGYSTCHWCHVMERESFEDEEVAQLLNESYIAIKVDREERPDIDSVYMNVCQLLNGSGGWPLSIWMTSEQKPFYAGTYLPKENRYGQPGLCSVLEQIAGQWGQRGKRQRIELVAEKILEELTEQEKQDRIRSSRRKNRTSEEKGCFIQNEDSIDIVQKEEKEITKIIYRNAEGLARIFDKRYGGFGSAPKFPVPHNLLFLLKMYEMDKNEKWLEMVEVTLRQMYRGGLFDHIGGGFSRYSTDIYWLVPHFEKMLYDNALLAMTYMEAYRITGVEFYQMVAERTLDYMERELGQKSGGFFCGQDADSEGEEGKYYIFTPEEIEQVLGNVHGKEFCQWYDVTNQGNFEKKSILNLLKNEKYEEEPVERETLCEALWQYRKNRTYLHRDDKILTSWNGLAIWAYAKAYQITGRTAYYKQAKKTAAFVRANLMTLNGRLKVRWRENHVAHEGHLDDYAFYAMALLELYQCDFDVSWLRTCMRLTEEMIESFEDKEYGGYFYYGKHGEALITRPKETYDGAIPSGNSVAALLLVRLSRLTGEEKWREAARRQMDFLIEYSGKYITGNSMAMLAIREWQQKGIHLVCCSREEIPEEEIRCFRKRQTETVDAVVITEENKKALSRLIPQLTNYPLEGETPVYYVCRGEKCQPPVTELTEL